MQEPYKTTLAVVVLFYGKNEVTLHQEEESDRPKSEFSRFGVVAGLQADLLDSNVSTPVVEEVGHPREVFVHAGSLSRALGCTVQTARNRLKELEEQGLVREHGDITVDVGNVKLFRPTIDSPIEYLQKAEKLTGNTKPAENDGLTPVMPSDFTHVEDGRWQHNRDDSVIIDVTTPNNMSIRQSIQSQLRDHGLKATSLKNFQHQLRTKAGLI